jgi:ABC-type oligopeptide transport system ATPase subunit
LTVENAGKHYGPKHIFSGAEFIVTKGEKIGLVGRNGEGKSTMMKMIAKKVEFDGNIKLGHSVLMGYFEQDQEEKLDPKKTVFEKQNLYRLSDGSSEYRIELYINEELGHMEFTVGMDRFEGFQVISKKVYSFSETIPQTSENSEKFTRSFGGVIGYSTFMGEISLASVSYGGYIDFGRVGLEYHNSVSMNMNSADAYINGQSDKYVGGGGTMNLGFFSKFNPREKGTLYLGLGVQSYEEISVENVNQVVFSTWYNPMTRKNETRSQTVSTPQVTEDKKILPYITIGTLQKLGENFTLKAGLILSECSMINVGVGYNF